MRGTLPKQVRVRDADGVRRQAEFTHLTDDGQVRGPELPADIAWPSQTCALYEALRRDPVAQVLTPADWCHVHDTMVLHRELWLDQPSNALKVAGEVRLRLAQLGVTPEARLRLRMLISEPNETEHKQTPRVDAQRKAHLTALANG
jgi:hypothetical protein